MPPACSAASHVVREALKWKAKDAEAVDVIHSTAPELIAVYKQLQGQPDGVPGACVQKETPSRAGGCRAGRARIDCKEAVGESLLTQATGLEGHCKLA